MAKKKTFEVTADAPEVEAAIAVDQVDADDFGKGALASAKVSVDAVDLEVPMEMVARVAADVRIPFGGREEVPVILRQKCSVPLAVGECMAVVTLPAGINLDMLAYAIRHGYAGRA